MPEGQKGENCTLGIVGCPEGKGRKRGKRGWRTEAKRVREEGGGPDAKQHGRQGKSISERRSVLRD